MHLAEATASLPLSLPRRRPAPTPPCRRCFPAPPRGCCPPRPAAALLHHASHCRRAAFPAVAASRPAAVLIPFSSCWPDESVASAAEVASFVFKSSMSFAVVAAATGTSFPSGPICATATCRGAGSSPGPYSPWPPRHHAHVWPSPRRRHVRPLLAWAGNF